MYPCIVTSYEEKILHGNDVMTARDLRDVGGGGIGCADSVVYGKA